MKKAIYAGSFDPLTKWHLDIIKRSANQTEELTVWIWVNPSKNYMFSLKERENMLKKSVSHLDNVRVESFTGLLVKYAYENWIWTIIRWIRNAMDFTEEMNLSLINESQNLWIETFFLPTKNDKSHISSSAAKWIQKEYWAIQEYVPIAVKQSLEARMASQFFVWITWQSGAWKSTLTKKLIKHSRDSWFETHEIDLDKIWHEILWELQLPVYQNIRKEIIKEFWKQVENEDWTINRKELWILVFWDTKRMEKLNSIMFTPMITQVRDKIYWKKWLFFVDAALMAEFWLSYLVNNNIILVDSDKKIIEQRLKNRDWLDNNQVKRRTESQMTAEWKIDEILNQIKQDWTWRLIEIDNTNELKNDEIMTYLNIIINTVDIYWELRICNFLDEIWIKDPKSVYEEIRKMYSWNDRFYHDLSHIVFWLNALQEMKWKIDNIKELTLAWIFHDIIYDSTKSWNEEASAEFVIDFCKGNNLEYYKDVERLILITKHNWLPNKEDEKIIVDIDLAILWQDWDTFSEYEKNVRREYSGATNDQWKDGRIKVLKSFLDREFIYFSKDFKEKYEEQARENLKKSINILKS